MSIFKHSASHIHIVNTRVVMSISKHLASQSIFQTLG